MFVNKSLQMEEQVEVKIRQTLSPVQVIQLPFVRKKG